MTTSSPAPGRLIEGAFRYDVKLWARSLGRERAFRRELAKLARLAPGESVLVISAVAPEHRRSPPSDTSARPDSSTESTRRPR